MQFFARFFLLSCFFVGLAFAGSKNHHYFYALICDKKCPNIPIPGLMTHSTNAREKFQEFFQACGCKEPEGDDMLWKLSMRIVFGGNRSMELIYQGLVSKKCMNKEFGIVEPDPLNEDSFFEELYRSGGESDMVSLKSGKYYGEFCSINIEKK